MRLEPLVDKHIAPIANNIPIVELSEVNMLKIDSQTMGKILYPKILATLATVT